MCMACLFIRVLIPVHDEGEGKAAPPYTQMQPCAFVCHIMFPLRDIRPEIIQIQRRVGKEGGRNGSRQKEGGGKKWREEGEGEKVQGGICLQLEDERDGAELDRME